MRILLLTQFYPPIVGGEENHVRALAHGLVDRGHEVCVVTLWRPDAPAWDGRVRLRHVKSTTQRISGLFSDPTRRHAPPFPDPELALGLWRIIRLERPDIVHAHNWIVHSFLPVKAVTGVPLVLTLHDYGFVCAIKNATRRQEPCDGPNFRECLNCACDHYGVPVGVTAVMGVAVGRLLQRWSVDAFIAVSRIVATFNGFEIGEECQVIPNFVRDDVERIDPAARLDSLPSEGFILYVGDINRQKGLPVLLDAYSRLEQPPPLVLIGRKCGDIPAALPKNVHLLGILPHDLVKLAWSRCLFGVVPSVWRDPCPSVAMEGLAFGKPIIASDIGGLPSIIENEETGLLVAPGDAGALSTAMSFLLKHPEVRQRMGKAAADAGRRFKASAVVERIEEAYRRASSNKSLVTATFAENDSPMAQEDKK